METKNLKTIPKISVRIWRPLIAKLDEKIEAACLKRDAYLRRVLERELEYLDEEVSIPNSQASYDYIFGQLDAFDRKLVSLSLPPQISDRLNEICARKRIVRDAFFNRLYLLLAGSSSMIDRLLFADLDHDWRVDVWTECRNDGPFFQNVFSPLDPDIDPFWPLRSGLQINYDLNSPEGYVEPTTGETIKINRDLLGNPQPQESLYTLPLRGRLKDGCDLVGFSCYLPDSSIPGHVAEVASRAKLEELLAGL